MLKTPFFSCPSIKIPTSATARLQTLSQALTLPRLANEYDVAGEMLTRHFAPPSNVGLQCHRFREHRQLQGEPITDFIVAFRELAALRNFATEADKSV